MSAKPLTVQTPTTGGVGDDDAIALFEEVLATEEVETHPQQSLSDEAALEQIHEATDGQGQATTDLLPEIRAALLTIYQLGTVKAGRKKVAAIRFHNLSVAYVGDDGALVPADEETAESFESSSEPSASPQAKEAHAAQAAKAEAKAEKKAAKS